MHSTTKSNDGRDAVIAVGAFVNDATEMPIVKWADGVALFQDEFAERRGTKQR
jgi:hypothetical protein